MILTIITINRNNAAGLEKTIRSVLSQTRTDFEYVVVDGASTDGSEDVIRNLAPAFGDRIKWVSEPDDGIYNAMNKGMRMASGEYFQILNSGDCLAADNVTERMLAALEEKGRPSILYGNMIKCFPDGRKYLGTGFSGYPITMVGMYLRSLNHDPTYIRRDLFDKYGVYDENLKIVSDWKWFFQAIVLGEEVPEYVDIDVTLFDMTGISETNLALRDQEKRQALEELVPPGILADYDQWAESIYMVRRLKKHPWAFRLVWFLERYLNRKDKRRAMRRNRRHFQGK